MTMTMTMTMTTEVTNGTAVKIKNYTIKRDFIFMLFRTFRIAIRLLYDAKVQTNGRLSLILAKFVFRSQKKKTHTHTEWSKVAREWRKLHIGS
jgi:hypothetical protein